MRTSLGLLLVLCLSTAVFASQQDTDRIRRAVQQFKDTFNRPPFDRYIVSVEFTTLEAQREYHDNITLTHDETWQSWCLDVIVGFNLPLEVRNLLPATFWEFKVFINPRYPSDSSSISSSSSAEDCTEMTFICPDGTYATRTKDCLFVCGELPIGGLSYEQVTSVEDDFLAAYNYAFTASIDNLESHVSDNVYLYPSESLSDYCIVATLPSDESSSQDDSSEGNPTSSDSSAPQYPGVYNGVRIFYVTYTCSAMVCPDGSYVGCNEECPDVSPSAQGSFNLFVPVSAIVFVVALSACCCYLKGKRCPAKAVTITTTPSKAPFTKLEQDLPQEFIYPAEQYELFQNQEPETEGQLPPMMPPHPMFPMMHMMHPQMGMVSVPMPMLPPMSPNMNMGFPPMGPNMNMGFPPMPPMPPMHPGMMMNGQFPVMIQGPNGMWYPAPPQPEDA